MNVMAVDIGNSTISVGISKGTEIDVYRLTTHPVSTADYYTEKLRGFIDTSRTATIEGAVICSVVPQAAAPVSAALREITGSEPLVVDHTSDTGLKFDIANIETLGADRIASCVGAMSLADPPVIIVDFGTATTVNIIESDSDGTPVFRGGAILPGLKLMGEALETRAAQLPRIAHDGIVRMPGKNTEESILAGITYATAGGIERIIEEAELSSGLKYRVMVTGGMVEYAAAFVRRPTKRQPALTLRGLVSIYDRSHRPV